MDPDMSPTLNPLHLPAGHAPPTPPSNDALEDVYGSPPTTPTLAAEDTSNPHRSLEILSDLPSRQRALHTDAYREGLSSSKAQHVQEGFDEGYSLGANLGLIVGYILGVLQGLTAALDSLGTEARKEVPGVEEDAKRELAIQELLGQQWIDEEGIWRWDVSGRDGEVTFKEVSEQHPVIRKWMGRVEDLAARWELDLSAVERIQGVEGTIHDA